MFDVERAVVVAEARTWVGTPFHHAACIKGVGVDCVHLLTGVFRGAGMIAPPSVVTYSSDWFLHTDAPRFLDALGDYCVPLGPRESVLPGDVATFRYGRAVSHAGLVIENDTDPVIIHAYRGLGVTIDTLAVAHAMTARLAGYWRFRRWAAQ